MSKGIYIVENGTLYRATEDGQYTEICGGWSKTTAMTSLNGFLYMVDNTILYKTNPESGEYTELTSSWTDVRFMTAWNGKLFILSGSVLYSADPETGVYEEISGSWNVPMAIATV